MENLGHNSKAVHRAYSKRGLMKLPSLEEYEVRAGQATVANEGNSNCTRRLPGRDENPKERIFGWIGVVRGV